MQKKSFAKPKTSFRNRVLEVVRRIQKGATMSYGEVAARAGNPHAARAVGAIMAANRNPDIPCHKVIGKNGQMIGYSMGGGIKAKRRRLIQEGAL